MVPKRKKRGISQIAGNLVILGMVTAIGTGILIHGMNEINAFNYELNNHSNVKNKKFQENLVFEHIHFIPNSNDLEISIRNTGTTDINIDVIKLIKIDTQELIAEWNSEIPTLFVKEPHTILIDNANLTVGSGTWNENDYVKSEYLISIKTTRDNFFTTVALPFNT